MVARRQRFLGLIDWIWGKGEDLQVWNLAFAGDSWLTQAFLHGARILRHWPKNFQLLDEQE
jgi:hypothetical protein